MSDLRETVRTASDWLDKFSMEFDRINGKVAVAFLLYKKRVEDQLSESSAGHYGAAFKHEEALEELVLLADEGTAALRQALIAIEKAIPSIAVESETHSMTDPDVRQQVLALTGGKCAYCAIDLKDGGGSADQFCIEHVVPASKGGPNHIANYVPSCRSCNNSKGDRHVLYFLQNSWVLKQRAPS